MSVVSSVIKSYVLQQIPSTDNPETNLQKCEAQFLQLRQDLSSSDTVVKDLDEQSLYFCSTNGVVPLFTVAPGTDFEMTTDKSAYFIIPPWVTGLTVQLSRRHHSGLVHLPNGSHIISKRPTAPGEVIIVSSCLQRTLNWGGFTMNRFAPRSNFCDTFMSNLCSSNVKSDVTNEFPDVCKCFQASSSNSPPENVIPFLPKNLALPAPFSPACFHEDCIATLSYKTHAMLHTQYCAASVCNSTHTYGNTNNSTTTSTKEVGQEIRCLGYSYKTKRDFISGNATTAFLRTIEDPEPNVALVSRSLDDAKTDNESWMVYVILGVGGIILLFLTYFVTQFHHVTRSEVKPNESYGALNPYASIPFQGSDNYY